MFRCSSERAIGAVTYFRFEYAIGQRQCVLVAARTPVTPVNYHHFHYYATFLFKTPLHFAIRFRQSYLIWKVCDVTAIELSSKE